MVAETRMIANLRAARMAAHAGKGNEMLEKSEKFGTVLTVGPRLKQFVDAGIADRILWAENYPGQEEDGPDGRGEFQRTREWIETASLEDVFDLWCRGRNLIGFAPTILYAVETFNRVYKTAKPGRSRRRKG